ncbi:MAG: hypothetical protein H6624_19735 [Bdellovibrionaceae bacterium]|nr:hypothetical protein [Bdellovibrionales bacterium]MCB9086582.1 hypothetical protein [Pseudobdellovibrionaceae bacterium]
MKLRNLPRFTIPEPLIELMRSRLEATGYRLDRPVPLAEAVIALSDLYNTKGGSDLIWRESSHRAAYWAYFLPLNWLRLRAVVEEGRRLGFFDKVERIVDFGSGPGTGHLVWELLEPATQPTEFVSIESSPLARSEHQSWADSRQTNIPFCVMEGRELPLSQSEKSLALMSYSLNELDSFPDSLFSYSHVLIVEPSTRHRGRQLMEVRHKLIDKGYSLWGPCPHQEACPLLTQSKQDWCHDRILIERPDWMMRLEQHLPLDNRSLTFSYLLASREKPVAHQGLCRVIGDTQKEKGKTRQAACRGPKREFLAWLKKEGKAPIIPRGALVRLSGKSITKGNEIRPQEEIEILSCHLQERMSGRSD